MYTEWLCDHVVNIDLDCVRWISLELAAVSIDFNTRHLYVFGFCFVHACHSTKKNNNKKVSLLQNQATIDGIDACNEHTTTTRMNLENVEVSEAKAEKSGK